MKMILDFLSLMFNSLAKGVCWLEFKASQPYVALS